MFHDLSVTVVVKAWVNSSRVKIKGEVKCDIKNYNAI